MKKVLLLILLFLSTIGFSFAQQTKIIGKVVDTFNNEKLEYATITVLRASDSVLLGFARSDGEGNFSLKVKEEKKYLMLITCPGFADYIDVILPKSAEVNLGEMALFTREKLLSEFVIRQKRGSIIIKGDTTEYIADSFKVDANANVEALLKRLPGLQVDKDGQVTAQGEKVTKILVDGEEFFSDDPAVVNKNLQAKTIDKVQVFDKKSENAEFTGIDDGERIKTINLQLKDKYKKGYFGKIAVGGGTDGFFENQGMFNLFRGKMKFSVYGIAANTGKLGLSSDDNSKFGAGMTTYSDEESGTFFSYNGTGDEEADWGGKYNGQGLPKAWTAGAHFSDKWNKDKQHINFNYRFNRKNIEIVNNTLTQYTLPDSVYYNDQKSNTFSTSDRHGLTGLYEWTIDTLSTLKLTANAAQTNKNNSSNVNAETRGSAGGTINKSLRKTNNESENKNADVALIWKKRFKKKGRNVLLEADLKQTDNLNNGFLRAENSFFSDGIIDSTVIIDQAKKQQTKASEVGLNVTYTEPISKKGFMELKYKFSNQNNFSRQLSFNKNAANQYADLDTLFSTDYDFDVNTHRAGASFRWVYTKLNFSFGAAASNTSFLQTDNLFQTKKERNFNNFFPSAAFTYKFNKQSNLSLNYRGNTQQPRIEQLQPIRQNLDPLNISIGNPGLRQEFDNSISFRYNSYKVLKGTYYYASGGSTFTKDAISTSENIIESGIRTSQYVNVDGNYSAYIYAGAGYKMKKWNIDYGFNFYAQQGRNNNIINGLKNKNDNNNYTLGGRLSYDKEKKVSVSFNPSVSLNQNKSSISQINTSFWSTSQDVNLLVYLPLKFQINGDLSWNVRQKTAAFDRNNNVFQLNAFLAKKFTKKDEIEVRVSVYDIFNQNLGFYQYGNNNAVTQQSYNTIRRYGLLTFTWNFTGSAKEKPVEENQMFEIK
ncbi:MAG: outer membrane beta-barrel family protein [Chitinophagaceae bacterium]|jgi:hypothetical protein